MVGDIRIDDSHTEKIMRLFALYQRGEIPVPEQHEVHPSLPIGSRENYLYFTLASCLNFRRSSVGLWRSALATYADPECRYLFFPEEVRHRRFEDIQRDLTAHRLAIQINRHPRIWVAICRTLADHYDSDPRAVLREDNFEVPQIIQTLQRTKKHLFPYLGGRKLSNYWLFILSRFTDAQLANLDQISIIPDTNVIKSTIRLGLADESITPANVEEIWRRITVRMGINPIDMHPILWNWARNGCRPDV